MDCALPMFFFLPSCFVVNKYYDSDSVDYGKLQNKRFFYSGYLYKIHNNREFTELVDQLHGFRTQMMVV